MTIKGLTREEQAAFAVVAKRLAQEELATSPAAPAEISEKEKKKKQQEYFKKFDEQIREVPLLFQNKRLELVEATGWKPDMGDCELHFQDKLPGNRCAWSVKWQVGSGEIISPGDYYPLESMTSAELLLEAHDLCHQRASPFYSGPDPAVIEKEILPIVQGYEAGEIINLVLLRRHIKRQRTQYSTYTPGLGRGRMGWDNFKGLKEKRKVIA